MAAACATSPVTPPVTPPAATSGPKSGASQAQADRDWAAFRAVMNTTPPAEIAGHDEAFNRWYNERSQSVRKAGVEFYTAHPEDPRRWKAVADLLQQASDMEDDPATPANESEQWTARLTELAAALEASADAPKEAREIAGAFAINRAIMDGYRDDYAGDLAALQARIDAFAARFPQGNEPAQTQNMYLYLLRQRKPEAVDPLLPKLLQSPNEGIRASARGLMELAKARTTPVEMKFTALDGRKVDLAQLRGKVVLIDFWATWCKPCMAEMPNVRAAYEKFHSRGFEVIGVSLDKADDRQKLIDCVAKNNMAWPQHFDGQGWQNEYTQRYNITGIPATLLLDRAGKLIGQELRGEELNAAVERALAPNQGS